MCLQSLNKQSSFKIQNHVAGVHAEYGMNNNCHSSRPKKNSGSQEGSIKLILIITEKLLNYLTYQENTVRLELNLILLYSYVSVKRGFGEQRIPVELMLYNKRLLSWNNYVL